MPYIPVTYSFLDLKEEFTIKHLLMSVEIRKPNTSLALNSPPYILIQVCLCGFLASFSKIQIQ